ncbi:PhzF family phenazine biosynthesis protein [Rhizobium sp. CSW-27]|uniref:PhzF family phenazine biosynthesis protein n=1 Tax=Rhizobium sp. CSW-27 TaxID=2839985 RepID=UPI001C0106D7|nr:PhzF family phenazine biosynthesis protein [Rhizobium sp. CSW-27]MBT9369349.1 PhzF family phenazine biosynthesis protein [Rhizobium sp. CSW-27]
MTRAAFVTVDVFTQQRFTGNPLAVFPDARGLDDQTMQQIAAEFGYSEITFVLPPEDQGHDARVRIFTPVTEVPFAGHPNVGTAYVLGQQAQLFGKPVGDRLLFEEKAGLVAVELRRRNGQVTGAAIRAPRALQVLDTVAPETVAACASLQPGDVCSRVHPPRIVSVGLAFVVAELTDLDALGRARADLAAVRQAVAVQPTPEGDFPLFLYVRDPVDRFRLRARMFAPLDNVAEDPATGSASGALCAFLARLDAAPHGVFDFTIEQGVEMGRASLIEVRVEKDGGMAQSVTIAGACVPVLEGALSQP